MNFIIVDEKNIAPIKLKGRDVFNLVTPEIGSKKLSMGIDIIKPGGKTEPPHYHPRSDEVIYVIKGKIKVVSKNIKKIMKEGNAVFVPAKTIHILENIGNSYAKIIFCFSPPVKTGDWIEVNNEKGY